MKISIDAGHNTVTPDVGATGILFEDDVTREIAKRVQFKLLALGHQVKDCTPYGQTFNTVTESLAYRVNAANTYASSLHVCIHANVYDETAYGTEAWIYAPGGQSQTYATAMVNEICTSLGYYNRGVKTDATLYVPKNTNMPCVLIELFFIDNAGDVALYDLDKMANAIVKSITGTVASYSTPNATIVNDFFYLRDANGNLVGGQINVGEVVQVQSIDYAKQLAKVRYVNTSGALATGYITNAPNCIFYTFQDQYHNGSTSETVYSDAACTIVLGSLDPYEYATPITRESTHLNVVYDTALGENKKSGFVKYNGGFTKF